MRLIETSKFPLVLTGSLSKCRYLLLMTGGKCGNHVVGVRRGLGRRWGGWTGVSCLKRYV